MSRQVPGLFVFAGPAQNGRRRQVMILSHSFVFLGSKVSGGAIWDLELEPKLSGKVSAECCGANFVEWQHFACIPHLRSDVSSSFSC